MGPQPGPASSEEESLLRKNLIQWTRIQLSIHQEFFVRDKIHSHLYATSILQKMLLTQAPSIMQILKLSFLCGKNLVNNIKQPEEMGHASTDVK